MGFDRVAQHAARTATRSTVAGGRVPVGGVGDAKKGLPCRDAEYTVRNHDSCARTGIMVSQAQEPES